MASGIERLTDELIEYINECKFRPLSNTTIMVDKEKVMVILNELKSTTPDELKRYLKVVSNQEAILNDAKQKAQKILEDAALKTNEMVSQNAIMQQAYQQADEIVKDAYNQAQEMIITATNEAASIKASGIEYLDGILATYENIVGTTLNTTQQTFGAFYNQISQCYDTVVAIRNDMYPTPDEMGENGAGPEGVMPNEAVAATGNIGAVNNTQPMGTVTSSTGTAEGTGDIKLDFLP